MVSTRRRTIPPARLTASSAISRSRSPARPERRNQTSGHESDRVRRRQGPRARGAPPRSPRDRRVRSPARLAASCRCRSPPGLRPLGDRGDHPARRGRQPRLLPRSPGGLRGHRGGRACRRNCRQPCLLPPLQAVHLLRHAGDDGARPARWGGRASFEAVAGRGFLPLPALRVREAPARSLSGRVSGRPLAPDRRGAHFAGGDRVRGRPHPARVHPARHRYGTRLRGRAGGCSLRCRHALGSPRRARGRRGHRDPRGALAAPGGGSAPVEAVPAAASDAVDAPVQRPAGRDVQPLPVGRRRGRRRGAWAWRRGLDPDALPLPPRAPHRLCVRLARRAARIRRRLDPALALPVRRLARAEDPGRCPRCLFGDRGGRDRDRVSLPDLRERRDDDRNRANHGNSASVHERRRLVDDREPARDRRPRGDLRPVGSARAAAAFDARDLASYSHAVSGDTNREGGDTVRKHLVVRLVVLSAAVTAALAFASSAFGSNYIVLYKNSALPADVAGTVQKAGGTLLYSYDQIGVAIAQSSNASFRANLLKDSRIENASSTAGFATQLNDSSGSSLDSTDASGPPPGDLPNATASDADSLSPLQWDMRQINAPQAHAITGGNPAVLVGDIDTGIDFHHPDLRPNIDVANSVNCVSGAPVPGTAAQDDNGHGTHTAGTIAAASNGFGIVGVAPNVHIAAIKAGNAAGFFFPEAVVCSFVWAATHGVDVTNNSYFADPYLFNCKNDPVQRAIWKAEQRAILFAESKGVTVVAAAGNESEDLAHPSVDATSPDDTTPVTREVTNACVVIPVEVPGVIGVTAVGNARQTDANGNLITGYLKSFYSNVGVGVAQLTAPGGDSVFGRTPEAVNGRVLSTWPPYAPCTRKVTESIGDPTEPTVVYCYLQGTSMASPHVAGVAALIISQFGNLNSPNGKMAPQQVKAFLGSTADAQPCPTFLPPTYEDVFGVGTETGLFYPCTGGPAYNSWYGSGQVNALNAVTHSS